MGGGIVTAMSHTMVVFPGQGAQSVGMLSEVYEKSAVFRRVFEEAAAVLGYDVWRIIKEGPAESLNKTEITQPALLACSVGCFRTYQSFIQEELKPQFFAGHSLGEYSALVNAKVCSLKDGLGLVAARGRLMQTAVPSGMGGMMAILGLDSEGVQKACSLAFEETGEVVAPANFNTFTQTVIAGTKAAVAAAGVQAKVLGAKRTIPLAMSVPSHCALLKEAAIALAAVLETVPFQAPEIPIVHNVTALPEADPEKIKQLLVEQLYSPVRWVESMQYCVDHGVQCLYECGPGKVLTGLMKNIDRSIQYVQCDTISA